MKNSNIKCRIEEVPALSELTRDNYLRDEQLFAAFSPVFNTSFMEKYVLQQQNLKKLAEPVIVTGEMKKITGRISEHYDKTRNIINQVEYYTKKTGLEMNVEPIDFGFGKLRIAWPCITTRPSSGSSVNCCN
jgi:hypothetical protein